MNIINQTFQDWWAEYGDVLLIHIPDREIDFVKKFCMALWRDAYNTGFYSGQSVSARTMGIVEKLLYPKHGGTT